MTDKKEDTDIKLEKHHIKIGLILGLVIVMCFIMKTTYDKGYYDGATNYCYPLTPGLNLDSEYVCYNITEQEKQDNNEYVFNMTIYEEENDIKI